MELLQEIKVTKLNEIKKLNALIWIHNLFVDPLSLDWPLKENNCKPKYYGLLNYSRILYFVYFTRLEALFYYPGWMEMFALWLCWIYGVLSCFYLNYYKDEGLEDNIMLRLVSFRFVFNSGGWWGLRMKGLKTRMKVYIKLRKGEHREKEGGIDWLKFDWSIETWWVV